MELNEKYRIIFENKYVVLQFFEIREKQKLNPETRKYEGTGEFKEFTENFYFNNLEMALKAFVRKNLEGLKTANTILKKLEDLDNLIKTIKVEQSKI